VNIEKRVDFPIGARCLTALSGGGDSVALLSLASEKAVSGNLEIHAAKVIHGMRSPEEEEAEVDFCRDLCSRLKVPFAVLSSDGDSVKDIQNRFGCGPEQAAREFRKRLLNNHLKEISGDYILYGHTADDNLETVFMRLLSGSGPEGLRGISPGSGFVLRPLLGISRSELREYLLSRDLTWMEDRTNNENIYRRNRVRNELMPLIGDIFPGWEKALVTLGERSEESVVSLENTARVQLPCIKSPGDCRWKESQWDSAWEYSRALALWEAFNHLENSEIPDRQLSWRSLKEARRAVNEHRSWNAFNLSLERLEGYVVMSRSRTRKAAEGRILLSREDVDRGFDTVLGGYSLKAGKAGKAGFREHPERLEITMKPGDWPLELSFGRTGKEVETVKRCITDRISAGKSPDSEEELVYILIESLKEGIDAG